MQSWSSFPPTIRTALSLSIRNNLHPFPSIPLSRSQATEMKSLPKIGTVRWQSIPITRRDFCEVQHPSGVALYPKRRNRGPRRKCIVKANMQSNHLIYRIAVAILYSRCISRDYSRLSFQSAPLAGAESRPYSFEAPPSIISPPAPSTLQWLLHLICILGHRASTPPSTISSSLGILGIASNSHTTFGRG